MLNWISFTRLADTVVMLPAAALCLLWLVMGGATRLALWWFVLLSSSLALVAVTKIAFLGWGIGIPAWDFTGISGHAMRGTAVTPVVLYLVSITASRHLRLGAAAAGMVFGVLIGVSRLIVHAHSLAEVVAGCVLGAGVSAPLLWMMLRANRPTLRFLEMHTLPLMLLFLIPGFTAEPAPTEHWLQVIAMKLSGHEKVYQRGDYSGSRF